MHKVVILQARLASSRLPHKVLADLGGRPVIVHIVDRLRAAKQADEICVAIPSDAAEDPLAEALQPLDVAITRGSEHDVLGRYIQAAYQTHADLIVRATADNPLVSFEDVDRQLGVLTSDPSIDYVITEGYPRGITVESFTLKTLEKLDYLARHDDLREHVTLYLRKHQGPFAISMLKAPLEHEAPEYSLTLDTPDDYQLLNAIYDRLYQPGELVQLSQVLDLLKADEHLAALSRRPIATCRTA